MNITGSIGNMYQGPIQTRPYDFGTDAIERQRVSTGQSLIDADFEYGLQGTKWQTYSDIRKYPSFFEIPGTDITSTGVTSDQATPSIITIATTAATPVIPVVGSVITVQGIGAGNYSDRAQGSFIVTASTSGTSFAFQAKGQVPISTNLLTSYMVIRKGGFYNATSATGGNCKIPVSSFTSNNTTTVTVTTSVAHGLIAGSPIAVTGYTGGTGPVNGNWIVSSVPTPLTFTYIIPSVASSTTWTSGSVYVQTYSYSVHRPFDGGVIISPASPSYGASSIRQSKKVFRYQSGKGLIWSSGTLFCPNNDVSSVVVGSNVQQLTITTGIPHGAPQKGATIQIKGVTTPGVNGTYSIISITDSFNIVIANNSAVTTAGTSLILGDQPRFIVSGWHGSSVRVGTFDDQNGLFWEFDGQTLWVVKRSSTFQLSGLAYCTLNTQLLIGVGTRFGQQLKVGDKFILRGMTHIVTSILGDTQLTFNPPYRGSATIPTAQPVTVCKIKEVRVPQSQFNRDTIDGKGASGYSIDLTKMQMMGLQYTWYGAGFIDFMVRGADGNFVFAHRFKQNNINDEAYMRTGNMPVRYEIANETLHASSTLASDLDSVSTTSMTLNDPVTYWPSSGTVLVDNELISYTGKSGSTLTGLTRSATLTYNINDVSSTLSHGLGATSHIGGSAETVITIATVTPSVSGSTITVTGISIDSSYINSIVMFGAAFSGGTPAANTPYYISSVPTANSFTVSSLTGAVTPSGSGNSGSFNLYKTPATVNLISTTCCPSLTHWGSALIMDGLFDQDRGYLFNYQLNAFGQSLGAGSTTNLFLLRLAPSVSNGVIGDIGARDLLNRAQLLLQRLDVWIQTGTIGAGNAIISGILNPSFATTNIIPAANWIAINSAPNGSQPSFAQVCNYSTISGTVGAYVAGSGERVFSTIANAGSQYSIDLSGLKEICNGVIGGSNFFPDGPDTLLIQLIVPTASSAGAITQYSVNLFWGEAQA